MVNTKQGRQAKRRAVIVKGRRMEDLTSLIPVMKRARGFRLYALSGKRYLDLSLAGGHNLLGHKPHLLVNTLKQVCEKGVLSDLPSIYEGRFFRALRVLFPAYHTFLAATSRPDLLALAARVLGLPLTEKDIRDPFIDGKPSSGTVCVWRPFFSGNIESDIILPVIPTGLGPCLFVLCAKMPSAAPTAVAHGLSPLVFAAAAQGLNLLRTTRLPDYFRPDLIPRSRQFTQKDIYLVPRCTSAEYKKTFVRCLAAGILLPREPTAPAILPFELSPGELQNLLARFDNEG
jgi:hypothetical protein